MEKPNNLNVLIIDAEMCSVTITLEPWQLKQLNIDTSKVKKHKSRNSLNKEVTNFLENNAGIS